MQNDKGVAYRLKIARGRGRLKLGTAMSGVMMLAILPDAAMAAGPSSPYRISAPVLADATGHLPGGPVLTTTSQKMFQPQSAILLPEPAPQDLTLHPTTQRVAPIRTAAAGDVTINQGDITTTGDNMPGIAVTTDGSTSITAGTITTSGAYSPGVSVTGAGPIAISTSDISTSGDYSAGVSASGGADINVKTGDVTTTGVQSTGIYAHSTGGNVSINAGNVYALGSFPSLGIDAAGHDVSIAAGNIAGGTSAISAIGTGVGATVDLTVTGDIQSYAFHSSAIFARSDGSITIDDTGNISSTSELGLGRGAGIYAHANGDVTIDSSGTIKTYGRSAGIDALSYTGDVAVKSGRVSVYGSRSVGISATGTGKVTVTAGDVIMGGSQDQGIAAAGGSVDVTLSGDMDIEGQTNSGIRAVAYTGDAAVHNNGSITLGVGFPVYGIEAIAKGNVVVDGTGAITTGRYGGGTGTIGYTGVGVLAYSQDGSVSVTQGDIRANSSGVLAIAAPEYGASDVSHGININVGSVETMGTGQLATGIVALDYNQYSKIAINAGSVSTVGDYAGGINALAAGGSVDITGGSITTRGNHAEGITLIGSDRVDIALDSITTTGSYHSSGIEIQTNAFGTGPVSVDVGSISTAGYLSPGVVVKSNGATNIDVGSLTTAGTYSTGIYAESNDKLTVTAGTVTTSAAGAMGVYAAGVTGVQITSQSISTHGDGALGVLAKTGDYGTVALDLGTVTTKGEGAAGVIAVTGHGSLDLKADTITTSGGGAPAVAAYAFYGSAKVDVGTVSTSGIKSEAILAEGGTDATVTAGKVSTQGDNSNGIVIRSGSYGVGGTGVVTVDSVTTAGNVTAAIDAIAAGDADHASSMDITANTIATTGQDAVGVDAIADYGPLSIKAGSISTKGAESNGVLAFGGGAIGIDVGAITSAATSIYTRETGNGAVTFGITGNITSSAGDGIVAINQGGTTTFTIASGGGVQGAGDAIAVQSGGGNISISNAGTIVGGTGYAIDVSGIQDQTAAPSGGTTALVRTLVPVITVGDPTTSIANSGTIAGGVRLASGDDTLTNSGVFVVTKDSDFGAGNDVFVNSGSVSFAPAKTATAVSLLGLETFENSGIVDLRDGIAGDTLTLPGAYVGSGGAKLGLDVGANGVADKLVVAGVASGTTSIVLNATAADATLIAKPITLVQAGAGTKATAFTIANQTLGFVSYGLAFDAASNSFQLSATAGSAVHRLTKINEGAQSIWHQSADAWSSHMAELRDVDQPANRVWGQAYGQVDTNHGHGGGYDLGYRQDYYGGQAGVDLGGKRSEDGNGFSFGVTGGYLSSHLNPHAGPERVRFDTLNAGAYATLRAGGLFINLLGQYDHYRTNTDNSVEHWSDTFSGNAYGAQAEVGARLGSESFFAEPIATIAWQRTDLGTLQALGQSLDFGHDTGLTGTIGGRFGSTFDLKGGTKAVLYAKAAYVHAFKGKGGVLFESGGTSEDVAGALTGDYGKAAIGVNILSAGRVSGFIEGDGDIGGTLKGGGGRAGVRFKL
jgi:outer membrane autotransporter protein